MNRVLFVVFAGRHMVLKFWWENVYSWLTTSDFWCSCIFCQGYLPLTPICKCTLLETETENMRSGCVILAFHKYTLCSFKMPGVKPATTEPPLPFDWIAIDNDQVFLAYLHHRICFRLYSKGWIIQHLIFTKPICMFNSV